MRTAPGADVFGITHAQNARIPRVAFADCCNESDSCRAGQSYIVDGCNDSNNCRNGQVEFVGGCTGLNGASAKQV